MQVIWILIIVFVVVTTIISLCVSGTKSNVNITVTNKLTEEEKKIAKEIEEKKSRRNKNQQ